MVEQFELPLGSSPAAVPARARSPLPKVGAQQVQPFRAGDLMAQEMARWTPSPGAPDAEYLPQRDTIVGRIRDLARNSGWGAGAVTREVDAVIGARLMLSAKPDYRALGLDREWADEFATAVEGRWRLWTLDPRRFCDAGRHYSIGGLFGQAYRHYTMDGDALGVLHWLPDRGGHFATTLQVVHPDRLSNPYGEPDSERLRGGVEIDRYGAAVAYHVRKGHPLDWFDRSGSRNRWERVPRETPWGRPRIVHYFDKPQAGQTRGIARITPVVERLRMLDHYDRVELQAAVVNALLAAYIETPFDPQQVEQALSADDLQDWQAYRAAWHKENPVLFGGVRLPTLLTGEKINLLSATRPTNAFADFEAACLRNIAAATGLSYEQLSNDWSKVNYSSARAALIEVWRTLSTRRELFGEGFCTPIYAAFVEELVETRQVELPRNAPPFHLAMAAYVRCRWIGPGRGWVDPLKEAQAAALRMQLGLSTLEDECAEQGKDHEDVLDQLGRELLQMPEGVLHPARSEYVRLLAKGMFEAEQRENAA